VARTGITRADVAAKALEILDRDGVDGLNMRRLAQDLGVGTMTLYGYVRSKEEVLDAAVDVAVSTSPGFKRSGDWRRDLRTLIEGAWRNLNQHPALVQIRLREPVLRPEALRFGEAGMDILLRAGFPAAEAAQSFRLLFTYAFGFAGLSPDRDAELARRQADGVLATLDPQRYPHLTAAREEFSAAMAGHAAFAYGLERILDGLEARRAALPPS
jgi:AcrR family transcriptional regulator